MKNDSIKPIVFDITDIKERAEKGDGFACYILARSYDSAENGLKQDLKQAFYWYEKGHNLNEPRCTYGLGACYYFGDAVDKDLQKAYELHKEAYPKIQDLIEKESSDKKIQCFSKFCLGAYYYFGFGDINKNEKQAFELIYECAREGHLAAIYDLGANFYYNGIGTKKDLQLSKYYLSLAASTLLPRAIKKLEEYKDTYDKELS